MLELIYINNIYKMATVFRSPQQINVHEIMVTQNDSLFDFIHFFCVNYVTNDRILISKFAFDTNESSTVSIFTNYKIDPDFLDAEFSKYFLEVAIKTKERISQNEIENGKMDGGNSMMVLFLLMLFLLSIKAGEATVEKGGYLTAGPKPIKDPCGWFSCSASDKKYASEMSVWEAASSGIKTQEGYDFRTTQRVTADAAARTADAAARTADAAARTAKENRKAAQVQERETTARVQEDTRQRQIDADTENTKSFLNTINMQSSATEMVTNKAFDAMSSSATKTLIASTCALGAIFYFVSLLMKSKDETIKSKDEAALRSDYHNAQTQALLQFTGQLQGQLGYQQGKIEAFGAIMNNSRNGNNPFMIGQGQGIGQRQNQGQGQNQGLGYDPNFGRQGQNRGGPIIEEVDEPRQGSVNAQGQYGLPWRGGKRRKQRTQKKSNRKSNRK